MKRNEFILINAVIIFFMAGLFASAADVKRAPAVSNSVKAAAPAAANVPVKGQVKPVPAAANVTLPSQSKTAPAAANVTLPAQTQPVPAANVPAQNQAKPAIAGTAAPDQNKTSTVPGSPSTTAEVYKYDPFNKPDPFQSFIVPKEIEKKKVEQKGSTSIFPLQRAEVDSYRVVGIAGTEAHRVAIVEDAAKKFYPLVKGTRIGLYDGKVIDIKSESVIVEEYENRKARRIILKLRKN